MEKDCQCPVCGTSTRYFRAVNRFHGSSGYVKRTQRYPQYTDTELEPFFDQVSAGYCTTQATEKAGMDYDTIMNTLYSDDETMEHMLLLSMAAGALIRSGEKEAPADRWDGLYDEYLTPEQLANKPI